MLGKVARGLGFLWKEIACFCSLCQIANWRVVSSWVISDLCLRRKIPTAGKKWIIGGSLMEWKPLEDIHGILGQSDDGSDRTTLGWDVQDVFSRYNQYSCLIDMISKVKKWV